MKIELFAQVFELVFISWAEANDLNAQLFKQTCGIKQIKTLSRRWAVVWFFVFVFFILVAPVHFFLHSMISRDYRFSWMACSVISPAPRLAKCHCTGGPMGVMLHPRSVHPGLKDPLDTQPAPGGGYKSWRTIPFPLPSTFAENCNRIMRSKRPAWNNGTQNV